MGSELCDLPFCFLHALVIRKVAYQNAECLKNSNWIYVGWTAEQSYLKNQPTRQYFCVFVIYAKQSVTKAILMINELRKLGEFVLIKISFPDETILHQVKKVTNVKNIITFKHCLKQVEA